jgi:hypothetical protein
LLAADTNRIISSFLTRLDVPWPRVFRSLMVRLSVINMNLLEIPKAACLHPQPPFFQVFNGYTLGFLFAVLFIGLLWVFGTRVVATFTLRRLEDEDERRDRRSRFSSTVLSRLLLLMYLVYPGVSVTILSMFSCVQLGNNKSFLNADLHIQCWDATHYRYVGAAAVWVVIVPWGVPRFFISLLSHYRVPQMARLKVDNAWLQAAVKEAWLRGVPQPARVTKSINVETISTLHLEVLYAALVKSVSNERAAGILTGAVPPVPPTETLAQLEGEDDHVADEDVAARQQTKPPPRKLVRLILFVRHWRRRFSAFINPHGKDAAKLMKAPDAPSERRAFLLFAILSWSKKSGALSIPVVSWDDEDVIAAAEDLDEEDEASALAKAEAISFDVKRYGVSCEDLPRLQKRALKQVGFLYADYHVDCWCGRRVWRCKPRRMSALSTTRPPMPCACGPAGGHACMQPARPALTVCAMSRVIQVLGDGGAGTQAVAYVHPRAYRARLGGPDCGGLADCLRYAPVQPQAAAIRGPRAEHDEPVRAAEFGASCAALGDRVGACTGVRAPLAALRS